MAERRGSSYPKGGKSKAESARPDFSELLTDPPKTAESYWLHEAIVRNMGAQAKKLYIDDLKQHIHRVQTVEELYEGAILPLEVSPGRLREQLRIRPEESYPIEVPAIDVYSACLYYSNPEVLRALSKGKRRAAADVAYRHLGPLNYALDLGHYMAPLAFAVLMKSPRERDPEVPEKDMELDQPLAEWSVDQIMALAEDLKRGRTHAGTPFYGFNALARQGDHQPNRINFATALLLEVGEYFTFNPDSFLSRESAARSNQIAESALAIARHLLGPKVLGDYPYRVLGIGGFIGTDILRRVFDIETVDITRQLRNGELERAEAETRFAENQLAYLRAFERWRGDNPNQDGVAFEWLTNAILNLNVFRSGFLGTAYSRSSTHREDYPEDGAKGNLSSAKQSHDNLYRDGQERTPIQCKTGPCEVYATPPIHVVKARKVLGIGHSRPNFMNHFASVADQIEEVYRGRASAFTESDIAGMGQKILIDSAA